MVFFTCNACGQAVKKNQVEKHYSTKCRNCTVLSCIDCGKDFVGDEYQSHVKCITEDEKYGGKGFQPKPSSGKGEAKQANWIANIKKYVEQADIPGNLANLLKTITNYSNVPRKKQKFQNFLRCSAHVKDQWLADQAWDIFIKANQQDEPAKMDQNEKQKSEVKLDKEKSKENGNEADKGDADEASEKKSKKKKEKNEDDKTVHELQNGIEAEQGDVDEASVKKSKKKKKNEVDETIHELQNGNEAEKGDVDEASVKKSKKKKEKNGGDETIHELQNGSEADKGDAERKECIETEGQLETKQDKSKKKRRKHKTDTEMEQLMLDHGSTQDNLCNGDSSAKKKRKRDQISIPSNADDHVEIKCKNISEDEIQGHSLTESADNDRTKSKKKKKKRDKVDADFSQEVESREEDEKPAKKKKKRKGVEQNVENDETGQNGFAMGMNSSEQEIVHKKKKKQTC